MTNRSILVFATGGTIGMHETPRGLDLDPGFETALENMVAAICDPLDLEYRINHLNPPIESANADAATATRIARAISARVRANRPRGVVITHGTDTLAYTGARLAFELASLGSPVVLTGSQLPHAAANSDAPGNLSLAIRAAAKASETAPVSIAFNGTLIAAVRATKAHAQAMQGFRAERALGDNVRGVPAALLQAATSIGRSVPARVISFRFVPGIIAEDLRAAVGANPDGLVLECYGSGNAPMARPGMAEALREICERIPVAAVTQCATGGVESGAYAVGGELAATGVLDGADMTVEAALAKLSFALDLGLEGAPLRSFFALNMVGERS